MQTSPDLKSYYKNNTPSRDNQYTNTMSISNYITTRNSESFDMTSVVKASQALSGEIEYIKLIEKLMKVVTENAGAEKIILLHKNHCGFEFEASYSLGDSNVIIRGHNQTVDIPAKNELPMSIINFVERSHETFILKDSNLSQFENDTYLKRCMPKALLCMPFVHKGDVTRILYLENNKTKSVFTTDKIDLLSILSGQMVISIENASLYKQAVTDGLTKINNRAFFDNYLLMEFHEVKRYKNKLSLLILDIDHFKKFNDQYGHQTGNIVLYNIAQKISKSIRKSDLAARYGGEEFVVVMLETALSGAEIVAEKVRKEIEKLVIETSDEDNKLYLKVTVSIGVAEIKGDEERISLIERADKNLYKAKRKWAKSG